MPVQYGVYECALGRRCGRTGFSISVQCLVGYIPGRVSNGSENFWLVSLHDCYIGFAGAAPQHNAIGGRNPWGRVIGPSQRPLPGNPQHSQETNIHATSAIRTRNPNKRAAAGPRFRPRGHWDQPKKTYTSRNFVEFEGKKRSAVNVRANTNNSPKNF
jgi:hypothetical protein